MVMREDEIYAKIRQVLVTALVVEESEITPESRLTEDLGAESIDYLDIAFQTERAFGIKIPPSEMLLGEMLVEPYVEDGRITDLGMAELRIRFPQLRLDVLEETRDIRDVQSAFTVDTLVRFVQTKLEAGAKQVACPAATGGTLTI